MEVLTNAANAASKAIFGSRETETQSTTEPQSGQIGSGTVSDPYDAGNLRGIYIPFKAIFYILSSIFMGGSFYLIKVSPILPSPILPSY